MADDNHTKTTDLGQTSTCRIISLTPTNHHHSILHSLKADTHLVILQMAEV